MDFAQTFTDLLNKRNITAYRMSKDTGIPDRMIGRWKDGEIKPSFDNLLKIARYFNVTTDYLLTGKEANLNVIENDNANIIKNEKENSIMSNIHELNANHYAILALLKKAEKEVSIEEIEKNYIDTGKLSTRLRLLSDMDYIEYRKDAIVDDDLNIDYTRRNEIAGCGLYYKILPLGIKALDDYNQSLNSVPPAVASANISLAAMGSGVSSGITPISAHKQALKDIEEDNK